MENGTGKHWFREWLEDIGNESKTIFGLIGETSKAVTNVVSTVVASPFVIIGSVSRGVNKSIKETLCHKKEYARILVTYQELLGKWNNDNEYLSKASDLLYLINNTCSNFEEIKKVEGIINTTHPVNKFNYNRFYKWYDEENEKANKERERVGREHRKPTDG